jgi:hypothetical protein
MAPRPRTAAWLAALFVLATALPAFAQAAPAGKRTRVVTPGMTRAQTERVLGPPAETRLEGGSTILVYRGACGGCPDDRVELRQGRVVTASFGHPNRFFVAEPPRQTSAPAPRDTQRAAPPAQPLDARPWVPADTTRRITADSAAPPAVTTLAPAAPVQEGTPGEWRSRLLLRRPAERIVALPAASIAVPTGFGLDFGEFFAAIGYQSRTRFTEDDDGAVSAGFGLGDRAKYVGLEVVASSFSTLRGGGPGETGGLSFKLHRALSDRSGVAAGYENGVTWGDSDADPSLYLSGTHAFRLKADPHESFSAVAVTLGVGNGRFRFEDDVAEDNETVNVFGAVGVQVLEPLSAVVDWTGQDLFAGLSWRPVRRVPLVINAALADLTGSAGDGVRPIFSIGYGFLVRSPF